MIIFYLVKHFKRNRFNKVLFVYSHMQHNKILQLTFASNVFTFNATIDHRLNISFAIYAEGLEDSNNDFIIRITQIC